mmetsp:Transcript_18818/g.39466  ORF Transcript_18818/g.39466 Transcript_18818/m.39466 type:complete len:285 (-) Transcript_18818:267-1121(-)
MPRQGLHLIGMVGERRGRTYVIPSSHIMRHVPEFDGPVGGTARQHLLMNGIPTQSHNCIRMTPLPQSRFGLTTLLFLLLLLVLPASDDGGARRHHLRPHPIRLGTPRIHPPQYQRRLQRIHHVQIPNLNSRFERPDRHEIPGGHVLVVVVVGPVRRNNAPQRQAERKRRKRNVVMHVQIGRLGIEDVDFEGGKVLLRLGHHHERVPIVQSDVVDVLVVVLVLLFFVEEFRIVQRHVLQIFHGVPPVFSSSSSGHHADFASASNAEGLQAFDVEGHVFARVGNVR